MRKERRGLEVPEVQVGGASSSLDEEGLLFRSLSSGKVSSSSLGRVEWPLSVGMLSDRQG